MFLDYFILSKVMCDSAKDERTRGVFRKFTKWLVPKDYDPGEAYAVN